MRMLHGPWQRVQLPHITARRRKRPCPSEDEARKRHGEHDQEYQTCRHRPPKVRRVSVPAARPPRQAPGVSAGSVKAARAASETRTLLRAICLTFIRFICVCRGRIQHRFDIAFADDAVAILQNFIRVTADIAKGASALQRR